jgi:hypothetical protein
MDVKQQGAFPVSGRKRFVNEELTRPTHIRVRAATDRLRMALKHGITRVGFLPDINQSVEWPFDQFTKRRILKGDVVVDEAAPGGEAAAAMFRQGGRTIRVKTERDTQPEPGRSPRRKLEPPRRVEAKRSSQSEH